jgi:hypothetical protein
MGDIVNPQFLLSRVTSSASWPSTYEGFQELRPSSGYSRSGHIATSLDELPNDLGAWGTGLATEAAAEIARRAVAIDEAIADLEYRFFEDHHRLLTSASVAQYKTFMRENRPLRLPLITANSEGLISATWERGREAVLLRFIPSGQVHFAMVLEDEGGQLRRPWGVTESSAFFFQQPHALQIAQATSE